MLTSKQLKAWYKPRSDVDLLRFEFDAVLEFLAFEEAREYLKKGVTEKSWNEDQIIRGVTQINN